MLSLQSRGIIKSMEFNSFTRIHHEDTEIKVKKSLLEKSRKNVQKHFKSLETTKYCSKESTLILFCSLFY